MEIKVIASTKVGYVMPKDEAVDFSGKSAGICYLPDTLETLFAEAPEKTQRRADEMCIRDSNGIRGLVLKYTGKNITIDEKSDDEIYVTIEAGALNLSLIHIYSSTTSRCKWRHAIISIKHWI